VDERDFLAQALANPLDRAPLLVAADWLEENGQTELAEYIRTSVGLAEGQPGNQRANTLARLSYLARRALDGYPDDRTDLFPVSADEPRGRRKHGDLYRVVGQQVERRGGRGGWVPHEGEVPLGVARKLLGHLARSWARPHHERHSDTCGDRRGRDRMLRGQLDVANQHAYQLSVQARSGIFEPVRELRVSRAAFFAGWLRDAADLVRLVEWIAASGHQAPGEDARSLAYLNQRLLDLSENRPHVVLDGEQARQAGQLHQRPTEAMRRMGAPRVLPAPANTPW
jgi:uncharacterized protein (TIGR02996 family)